MFSDTVSIAGIMRAAGACTVTTATPHGLLPGYGFYISGVSIPLAISSLTRAGTVGTLVTTENHDLTLPIAPTITITGAADAIFNGTFTTINVLNRKTITFEMVDSGATSTSGAKLLNAASSRQQLNGFHQVLTVQDSLTLTFAHASTLDVSTSGGTLKANLRVTAAASIDRAIAAFTKQALNKAYMFAVLGDVRASNSRDTQTDMIALIGRGDNYRQLIQETVSLFVLTNTKDEIAARETRDSMSDLLPAITQAICFYRFPSSFFVGRSNPLVFVSHGPYMYDGAVYVHEFVFECATEMTVNDTVGYEDDVALRDIDLTQYPNLNGTGSIESDINLDEVPL